VEARRDQFTYSGLPWDWENALHLRQRQARELVKPGRVNVKYSRGGIIDIEYKAQYLQLLYGKDYPELRTANTLQALFQLRRLAIISKREHEELQRAYLFLRNLIDALRIVRGDASDLLLPDQSSEEFKSLARRLGYRQPDRIESARQLAADIKNVMEKVHTYYVNRFDPARIERLLLNDSENDLEN
jgi:glutamate-ammonia-ligase adenylyltransferase